MKTRLDKKIKALKEDLNWKDEEIDGLQNRADRHRREIDRTKLRLAKSQLQVTFQWVFIVAIVIFLIYHRQAF